MGGVWHMAGIVVQCISGPLQARTQSLEATVYSISPQVGSHHKAHQHCDNPCVNWWLGGYEITDCKGHAMHCNIVGCLANYGWHSYVFYCCNCLLVPPPPP